MNEQRFVVTDQLWSKLEPHLPGKASDSGVTAKDNRLFLEAVFWRVRTGSPWRDLPSAFLWELEHSVPAFSALGRKRCFRASFQCHER